MILKKPIGQEESRTLQLDPDRFLKPNMSPEPIAEDQGAESAEYDDDIDEEEE